MWLACWDLSWLQGVHAVCVACDGNGTLARATACLTASCLVAITGVPLRVGTLARFRAWG